MAGIVKMLKKWKASISINAAAHSCELVYLTAREWARNHNINSINSADQHTKRMQYGHYRITPLTSTLCGYEL